MFFQLAVDQSSSNLLYTYYTVVLCSTLCLSAFVRNLSAPLRLIRRDYLVQVQGLLPEEVLVMLAKKGLLLSQFCSGCDGIIQCDIKRRIKASLCYRMIYDDRLWQNKHSTQLLHYKLSSYERSLICLYVVLLIFMSQLLNLWYSANPLSDKQARWSVSLK